MLTGRWPSVRRGERKSQALGRSGREALPRPAPRGPSASLVQWFLTVQQFSIIIVKCLGPLDQRGPGIGSAAPDQRAPCAAGDLQSRRRSDPERGNRRAGPGRRSQSQVWSQSQRPGMLPGLAPQHLGRAARRGRRRDGPRTCRWPQFPLRGWRDEQSQCKCFKKQNKTKNNNRKRKRYCKSCGNRGV